MKKEYKRKDYRKKKDNEFKNCDIKDLLLCNPYSQETIMKIGEDEFYNYFYCDFNFEERIKEIDDELTKIRSVHANNLNDANEDINNLKDQKNHLIDLSNQKNNFEKNILSDGYQKARYICGNSGSGKSTYLGFLLRKLKKNYHYVIKFDLTETCERVNWCGNVWFNNYYNRTLGKFISVLLDCFNSYLTKNKKEEFSNYINRLKNYVLVYQNIYNNNNFRYYEFFEEIKRYVEQDNLGEKNYREFLERLKMSLNSIIFSSLNTGNNEDEYSKIKTIIYNALSLIILFAMAEKAKITDDQIVFKKKIIIAIDSLEHYINSSEVYNKDIVDMCELIDDFILSETRHYKDISNLVFSDVVKFIIAFRDTTYKMLPDRNAEDYAVYEANVTDWFLPSKILSKRMSIIKRASKTDSNVINALTNIVNDDVENHGFWGKIEQMHNYNKRRLFIYLCDALNEQVVKEYLYLCEKINYYDIKAEGIENYEQKSNYNKILKVYKNAARSTIVRALLNKIEEKSYFEQIFTIGSDHALGKSYVRRILTYICAKKQKIFREENGNYVSFNRLLRDAFLVTDVDSQKTLIGDVAEVLYNMNNSSREDTHWCQLIVIKFNDSTFTKENLEEKLIECIKNNIDDSTVYGVKITYAGRFFLNKLADFEYFACRYCKDSLPLFFKENLIKYNGKTRAIQIIQTVRERALQCVDDVKMRDNSIVIRNNEINYGELYSIQGEEKKGYLYIGQRDKEMTHAQRILDSHIGYLDQYRNHIIESELLNDMEKRELSFNILDEIAKYVDKLEELVNLKDAYNKYYIGGNRTKEKGEIYYESYRRKIAEAKNKPTEHIWIQR